MSVCNLGPGNRHRTVVHEIWKCKLSCQAGANIGHAKWNFLPCTFLLLTGKGPLKSDARPPGPSPEARGLALMAPSVAHPKPPGQLLFLPGSLSARRILLLSLCSLTEPVPRSRARQGVWHRARDLAEQRGEQKEQVAGLWQLLKRGNLILKEEAAAFCSDSQPSS